MSGSQKKPSKTKKNDSDETPLPSRDPTEATLLQKSIEKVTVLDKAKFYFSKRKTKDDFQQPQQGPSKPPPGNPKTSGGGGSSNSSIDPRQSATAISDDGTILSVMMSKSTVMPGSTFRFPSTGRSDKSGNDTMLSGIMSKSTIKAPSALHVPNPPRSGKSKNVTMFSGMMSKPPAKPGSDAVRPDSGTKGTFLSRMFGNTAATLPPPKSDNNDTMFSMFSQIKAKPLAKPDAAPRPPRDSDRSDVTEASVIVHVISMNSIKPEESVHPLHETETMMSLLFKPSSAPVSEEKPKGRSLSSGSLSSIFTRLSDTGLRSYDGDSFIADHYEKVTVIETVTPEEDKPVKTPKETETAEAKPSEAPHEKPVETPKEPKNAETPSSETPKEKPVETPKEPETAETRSSETPKEKPVETPTEPETAETPSSETPKEKPVETPKEPETAETPSSETPKEKPVESPKEPETAETTPSESPHEKPVETPKEPETAETPSSETPKEKPVETPKEPETAETPPSDTPQESPLEMSKDKQPVQDMKNQSSQTSKDNLAETINTKELTQASTDRSTQTSKESLPETTVTKESPPEMSKDMISETPEDERLETAIDELPETPFEIEKEEPLEIPNDNPPDLTSDEKLPVTPLNTPSENGIETPSEDAKESESQPDDSNSGQGLSENKDENRPSAESLPQKPNLDETSHDDPPSSSSSLIISNAPSKASPDGRSISPNPESLEKEPSSELQNESDQFPEDPSSPPNVDQEEITSALYRPSDESLPQKSGLDKPNTDSPPSLTSSFSNAFSKALPNGRSISPNPESLEEEISSELQPQNESGQFPDDPTPPKADQEDNTNALYRPSDESLAQKSGFEPNTDSPPSLTSSLSNAPSKTSLAEDPSSPNPESLEKETSSELQPQNESDQLKEDPAPPNADQEENTSALYRASDESLSQKSGLDELSTDSPHSSSTSPSNPPYNTSLAEDPTSPNPESLEKETSSELTESDPFPELPTPPNTDQDEITSDPSQKSMDSSLQSRINQDNTPISSKPTSTTGDTIQRNSDSGSEANERKSGSDSNRSNRYSQTNEETQSGPSPRKLSLNGDANLSDKNNSSASWTSISAAPSTPANDVDSELKRITDGMIKAMKDYADAEMRNPEKNWVKRKSQDEPKQDEEALPSQGKKSSDLTIENRQSRSEDEPKPKQDEDALLPAQMNKKSSDLTIGNGRNNGESTRLSKTSATSDKQTDTRDDDNHQIRESIKSRLASINMSDPDEKEFFSDILSIISDVLRGRGSTGSGSDSMKPLTEDTDTVKETTQTEFPQCIQIDENCHCRQEQSSSRMFAYFYPIQCDNYEDNHIQFPSFRSGFDAQLPNNCFCHHPSRRFPPIQFCSRNNDVISDNDETLQEAFQRCNTVCYQRVCRRQQSVVSAKREREQIKGFAEKCQDQLKHPSASRSAKQSGGMIRKRTSSHSRRNSRTVSAPLNRRRNDENEPCEAFTYVVPKSQVYWYWPC